MASFLPSKTPNDDVEEDISSASSNPPNRRPYLFHLDEQILNMAVLPYLNLFDVLRFVCTCKMLVKTINQTKYFAHFFDTKLSLIPRIQQPNRLVHYLVRIGYDLKQAMMSMMQVLYHPETYPIDLELFDVLHTVHDFSSRDRPNEMADNLLKKSNCYHRFEYFRPAVNELHVHILGLREQMRCGCSANRPCYWSSAPQHESSAIEHITFTLFSPLIMVHSFSLTPYQAFFHPEAPVYSPVSVSLQFLAPMLDDHPHEIIDDDNAVLDVASNPFYCYHETEEFPIQPVFKAQQFIMPSPILAIGGRVRIMLRGFHQRQTLEGENDNGMPLDEYYMCLSEVSLYGFVIGTNRAEELVTIQNMDQAEKERMAWTTGEPTVFTKFKSWLQ